MNTPSTSRELTALVKLALPIFIAQVAFTSLGVVDTIMSGRVSADDLAAVGLGAGLFLPVFIFLSGIVLAITPITARNIGEKKHSAVVFHAQQCLYLALPLGLLAVLLLWFSPLLLQRLDLSREVYDLAVGYLFWAALGLPGGVLFQAQRFFWEGLGITVPTLVMGVLAFGLNIPLNAIFIYGFGPIEAMGAAGCGVATALVMWVLFFAARFYMHFNPKTRLYLARKWNRPDWQQGILPLLTLGTPMALAMLFEIGLFSLIILFLAAFGTSVIGAHQVTMSFTALVFMLPLSLAMAMTIRIGHAYGEQDLALIRLRIRIGLTAALAMGSFLAVLVWVFRMPVINFYTDNAQVVQIASTLFIFAAAYQIFDSIQVAVAGVLRGLHDTKITMWITLFSYWGVALGLGYWLAFAFPFAEPLGVYGFWIAIISGFIVAAILLSWRLKRRFAQVGAAFAKTHLGTSKNRHEPHKCKEPRNERRDISRR